MDFVRWDSRPRLTRAVAFLAFEGWNDAGEAASLALQYLTVAWEAEIFASIEPEEFYDFTVTRPTTSITQGRTRAIEWPRVEFLVAQPEGVDTDVVLVRGAEPQLHWRTFCSTLIGVLSSVGCETVVGLGALLADVPHSRDVRISGGSENATLARKLNVSAANYEGPTGILGVLHDECTRAGLHTGSLWAAVPHYVQQLPSPKAALALLEHSTNVLDIRLEAPELKRAAEEYEREVSSKVAEDPDASAYVEALEADYEMQDNPAQADEVEVEVDENEGDSDSLTAEVERFLREQHGTD